MWYQQLYPKSFIMKVLPAFRLGLEWLRVPAFTLSMRVRAWLLRYHRLKEGSISFYASEHNISLCRAALTIIRLADGDLFRSVAEARPMRFFYWPRKTALVAIGRTYSLGNEVFASGADSLAVILVIIHFAEIRVSQEKEAIFNVFRLRELLRDSTIEAVTWARLHGFRSELVAAFDNWPIANRTSQ